MALRRQNQFLVIARPGDSSRADGWLDELDEDAIRVDREHESPERTLNGLSVDAEETVTRARRALEKRVEASDLELELRRAHILHSPLERLGRRDRGRGPRESVARSAFRA
jgi:hypothetical protein